MDLLGYGLYFGLAFVCATLFALLEIQIEGKNGWAGKLPTWRIRSAFFRYIPGGTDVITGYHFYLWSFLLAFSHIPFIFVGWNLKRELLLLSFLVLVLFLEDFLWFVFNPHYGLSRFNRKSIPWHHHWIGPFPMQYYTGIIIWCILFWIGK
jgi:hypothetical protein